MTINRLSEKFMIERFYNMRCLVMFITAVCLLSFNYLWYNCTSVFSPLMTFKIFDCNRNSSPWCSWRQWKDFGVSVQWEKSALYKLRWQQKKPFCLPARSFRAASKRLSCWKFDLWARGNGSAVAKYHGAVAFRAYHAKWLFLSNRSAYGRMWLLHFQWPLDRCTGDCHWISLSSWGMSSGDDWNILCNTVVE